MAMRPTIRGNADEDDACVLVSEMEKVARVLPAIAVDVCRREPAELSMRARGACTTRPQGRPMHYDRPAVSAETAPRGTPMSTCGAFDSSAAGLMADIAFVDCELLGAAQARARAKAPGARGKARAAARTGQATVAASRRREVVVGGRRVKTIDVHAHCVIPEAYALLGLKVENHRGPGIDEVGPRRIREMDAQGIDMEALSINPAWYRAERDVAEKVIKIQNEALAGFCAKYPDRFVAF